MRSLLVFLLQPVGCALVIVLGSFLGAGATSAAAVIAVPFMVRSKCMEALLIRMCAHTRDDRADDLECSAIGLAAEDIQPLRSCRVPTMKGMLGGMKTLDAVSDGMCIGLAILLDGDIHDHFCKSLASGVFWWLSPLANSLHLAGVMSIVLLMSNAVQAALVSSGPSERDPASLPESAGFYLLMEREREKDPGWNNEFANDRATNAAFTVFTEVGLEQAPQLKLQLSLMMAQGQGLLEEPAVLLSVAVGCLTILAKGVKVFAGALQQSDRWSRIPQIFLASLLFTFVLYAAASAVMMEVCDDHVWGLTTGCVDV